MTIASDSPPAQPFLMAGAPLALLLTGSLLGLTLDIAKAAFIAGASPLSFLFWTLLGATIIVSIVAVSAGQAPSFRASHLGYGVWSGLLSVAAPNALLFLAIPHTGAGFVALCGAFPPLYTYLLALALRMEPPQWLRAAGVLAGIGGAVILGLSKASVGDSDVFWIALALSVPVIIGVGNIYRTRYWPKGASALQLAPLMLAGAVVWVGLFAAASDMPQLVPTLNVSTETLLLPLQIGLVALMYVMYFVLQKIAGPVYFSQIGSVSAVLGAVIAAIWFGESFPPAIIPAALLILFGAAAVTLAPRLMQRKAVR